MTGRANRMVLDVADRRPIWAAPEWAIEEIREALPESWELHVVSEPTDGSGDGAGGMGGASESVRAIRGARAYVGFGVPEEVIEAGAETLEWVHTGAAGVGSSLHPAMRESRVRFTNSAGIHGPPMAETVLGMLLHFTRGLDLALASQSSALWDDDPFLDTDTPVRELSSMTVGIVGYGGIGREVGWRLRALGSRVLGLRRGDPTGGESPLDTDEHGAVILRGDGGLRRLLAESDAVVLTAPETEGTRGLLSGERIAAMANGAVLVNVARGSLVDEDALFEALHSGHLRGAALDVFQTEPLPAGHPLWSLPNVLITPHVSAVTRGFWRRQVDLITGNLERLLAGQPLLNEVDRARGY